MSSCCIPHIFPASTNNAPSSIAIIFLIPFSATKRNDPVPITKVDERDTIFSRRLLKANTDRYNDYYNNNNNLKEIDDLCRELPGLLSNESKFYHPEIFSASKAVFDLVKGLQSHTNGDVSSEIVQGASGYFSSFIKGIISKMGSHSVGITESKDYHFYSFRGREFNYGDTVKNKHKFAIAFTVEMDRELNMTAPLAPTLFESANQYYNSASIAVQVAKMIRDMGYAARAHIDGDYELICPLVAKDAGLGEIGRMGLLMTPNLGPRVRIAVVTTDLPLIADKRFSDSSVINFCELCKKCADTCPGKAIPFGNREDEKNLERWKINSEACFNYWCTVGTDCGRCMAVCPYSHPDNIMHSLTRALIKRNVLFRRLAVKLDDFLYGRKPTPAKIPGWTN